MNLNGHPILMHKQGLGWAESGPLRRAEAEVAVRNYLEHDYHAVLFLMWEVKPVAGHPENDKVVKEFCDILEAMGLITN
jgi:hypothetical protein